MFIAIGATLIAIGAYAESFTNGWVSDVLSSNAEAVTWGTIGSGVYILLTGLLGLYGHAGRKPGPLNCYCLLVFVLLAVIGACTGLVFVSHEYRGTAEGAGYLVDDLKADSKSLSAEWTVDVYQGWATMYAFCAPGAMEWSPSNVSAGVPYVYPFECSQEKSEVDEWVADHCLTGNQTTVWPAARNAELITCHDQLEEALKDDTTYDADNLLDEAIWVFCACPGSVTLELYNQSLVARIVGPIACVYVILVMMAACAIGKRLEKAKKRKNFRKLQAEDSVENGYGGEGAPSACGVNGAFAPTRDEEVTPLEASAEASLTERPPPIIGVIDSVRCDGRGEVGGGRGSEGSDACAGSWPLSASP